MEIWKDIPEWEGLYQVSNLGRVKSLRKRIILKPLKLRKGYLGVEFRESNKRKHFRVHRLVALVFIPNPENKPEVNHKDGIKSNNHVDNLEWCTASENVQHAYDTGLKKPNIGEINGRSKLTEQQAIEIRNKITGKRGEISRLAREYGVHHKTIIRLLNRVSWTHI
jgi:hypothetical protein